MFIQVRTYSWLFVFSHVCLLELVPIHDLEWNWNIHEYSGLFMFLEFQESRVTGLAQLEILKSY